MRISDLITVHDAPRAIDLAGIDELSQTLEREGTDLTLGTATRLQDLLEQYVAGETEPVDLVRVILGAIAADGERGGGYLVRGPGGSGKSHLLGLLALLLRHPTAWSVFLQAHSAYADLRDRITQRSYLVVSIPLSEHRGHEEHLEDVIFDRTEQALRFSRLGLAVPLSEQSHALDLIDRHIVPRYAAELDTYTQVHAPGFSTWQALREHDPEEAVQLARQFAQEISYPLDFRQSRVERLARLLEILREHNVAGTVWLLDDLNEFLAGADPKAVHGDCSFLDFVGQRCKIAPLYLVATLDEGLEQVGSVEPYLLGSIRTSYRADLALTPEHMRTVARRRVIRRTDPDSYAEATEQVRTAYQSAFGTASFSREALADSYPLHPTALQCLESIAGRFFSAADTLVAFMHDLLDQTVLAGALSRDCRRLITTDDVFDYLRPRIASHPEVSAYIYDVLDYYQKNAAEVFPEAPELCLRLVRALIVLRLANITAPLPLLVESLGLGEDGRPTANPEQAEKALEAMRLSGSFVDLRRGVVDGPAAYYVDVRASVSEILRRRVAAAKASFAPDDPRLWRHVLSACEDPAFPLAQLTESRTLEVQWHNTFHCVSAQLLDLATLTPPVVAEYVADLGDPATVEDAHLFLGRLPDSAAQRKVWAQLREAMPANRWSAALLAWIPRDLSPQELDHLKEYAAIADMLEDESALSAEPGLRDELLELHGPALTQIRKNLRAAYYAGEVLSPFGHAVTPGELGPLSGDWSATLEAATERAFDRVFPDFGPLAPRRPLLSRDQIDTLVDRVLRPGVVSLGDEDPLVEMIRSFLEPLGLISFKEDQCIVDVTRSKVAAEVMAKVRQRDQTPQNETGRPLSCSDLAQHLVKSPLGLPPEMFELVIGALIRTGYLAAVRSRTQLVRLEDVATPLSGSVQYVARPPMLSGAEWQVLARVCRIVLDYLLPGPDLSVQMQAWERLLSARDEYLSQVSQVRQRLTEHIEALESREAQWRETLADLDALTKIFQCVRPELHPALGLQEFIRDVEDYVGSSSGTSRLSGLFRRIDALSLYLDRLAPEVVAVRSYLLSPELRLERGGDMDSRRQLVLGILNSGEAVLSEEMNLRRQVQIFLTGYRRRYASWHGRVYRSPVFDQYRSVHQSPEMRALQQLSKLRVDVDVTAEDLINRIDAQMGRRCSRTDFGEALDYSPVCPDCHLRLDEEPELMPVEELIEEARQAIRGYARALADSPFRSHLRDYAQAAPRRGDVPEKIEAILELGPDPSPREILNLFTEDVLPHLNRILSGKQVAPRNFGELRDMLDGRTLSKAEAQALFQQWLSGGGDQIDDDGLLQIEGS